MGKKNRKLKERKIRCLVTGKILNMNEAISIKNISTYLEKQGIEDDDFKKIKELL